MENCFMARPLMTTEQILAALRATPDRLSALTSEATELQLHTAPEPGEWSVVEVLAHLRACSDVWGDAIGTIVAEDHPTIRAINPRTWTESTDYRELEFGRSLQAFTVQRRRHMVLLESLRGGDWSRSATVLGAGTPLELSAHRYASRWARHEHAHWRQLEKTVASLLGPTGRPGTRFNGAGSPPRP
jgi:hypothetical protein